MKTRAPRIGEESLDERVMVRLESSTLERVDRWREKFGRKYMGAPLSLSTALRILVKDGIDKVEAEESARYGREDRASARAARAAKKPR